MKNLMFLLFLSLINLGTLLFVNWNFKSIVKWTNPRLVVALVVVVGLLVLLSRENPDQYEFTFSISVVLFGSCALKNLVYSLASPPNGNADKIRGFFDKIVFPFFVAFVTLAQGMYLLV